VVTRVRLVFSGFFGMSFEKVGDFLFYSTIEPCRDSAWLDIEKELLKKEIYHG